MLCRNLAVFKTPDGEDLEFNLNWGFTDIDGWMRRMVEKKGESNVFEFMDVKYGVPDGEGDSHWAVAGKSGRKIFVKQGPINGELLDRAKGTASGHRRFREHAIRISPFFVLLAADLTH